MVLPLFLCFSRELAKRKPKTPTPERRNDQPFDRTMQLHYLKNRIELTNINNVMATTPLLSSESTLTDRYQTTIPEPIRKALGLNKRDKIRYTIEPDGRVIISRADESDPILEKFLDFLEQDMEKNPQRLQAMSSDLLDRAQSLIADVEVDLDAPLSDEDE